VDERIWKNTSIVLGVVCALLIGVAGALLVVGHKSGPSTAASESPSGEVAVGTATPRVTGGTGPSVSHAPTKGPTPTPGKPSPATITFTGLGLDSGTGNARTFTFTSNGAGPATYSVTKISSGGTVKMCASVDKSAFQCQVGISGRLPNFPKGVSDPTPNEWVVTLIGYRTSAPTVDVTFTWTTSSPKITLTHGRFQGTGASDGLNGFSATFKPRSAGSVNVQATWTLVNAKASMTLLDATTAPSVTVDSREYDGVTYINPAFTANVDPTKTYLVKLRNTSADSQHPDLTAQITFP
jgi:hypothetical protein